MGCRSPPSYLDFLYFKNSENPKEWLIDEPAANVVRQIFDMCVAGFGPTQIAKKLKAAEVITPTEYWNSIGREPAPEEMEELFQEHLGSRRSGLTYNL